MTKRNGTKGLALAGAEAFAPKTERVQLPSQVGTGAGVELRRPNIVDIIKNGEAPDVLTNMLMENIQQGGGTTEADKTLAKDDLPAMLQMLETIAAACFVTPEMVVDEDKADASAGIIYSGWLDFNDLSFVFGWAMGEQSVPLGRFRQEPTGNVEAVSPEQGVQPVSE